MECEKELTGRESAGTSETAGTLSPGEGRDPLQNRPCFVVGIGASAGGQAALEHIFTTLPTDCDLSFVVIMHLPPDGPSLLADMLRRYTSMEVRTAENETLLLPNTVHVIPPGVELTVNGGRLRVERRSCGVIGVNHPIDRFFTSLAMDFKERAIAVVLSGFGMDGAEGVKRIKETGGAVLIHKPETAVNHQMPGNAIATGAADLVLATEEIPVKITEIARGKCQLPQRVCLPTTLDDDLNSIFSLVKARTGHDFSSYKRSTIMRRIERRMTVNESGGLRKYRAFLEQNPQEAQAFSQEMLIGVTGFFRDPEAFEVLQSDIIPRLFANRSPEDPVRIWHACCATGEEVYSVAMQIREQLEKTHQNTRVQIFATDIDEAAIAQARAGHYADDFRADVGEERLKAFFTRSRDSLQVVKELREMILFANHNIIKDPPFSRLDLLVCRNFLIYLNPDMQKRLISLFHLVLKPGGILFLGASETVEHNSDLFTPLNQKCKIFQRLESKRRPEAHFPFTAPVRKPTRTTVNRQSAATEGPTPGMVADRILVERYSPPSVVINEKYEVLHISAKTRHYLEVPVGTPSLDILKMAGEGLRPALRAAVYKSFAEDKQVVFRGVKVAGEEGEDTVNVLVEPLAVQPAYGKLALVILEPVSSQEVVHISSGGEVLPHDEFSKDMLIRQLEEQLKITHEQLRFTIEQLETSNEGFMSTNEELMSINEEFQSANEELQSTNEELEASKEELHALNEELVTVNSELQGKVEELHQANGDMENLFSSSGIAAIFLDRHLTIKRFSPAMAVVLNLIPSDLGRTFRHRSGTIDWPRLPQDIEDVLEKQSPIEREVNSREDSRCFSLRILPYLTTKGKIDGIVITLMDITELKRAEDEIRSAAQFPLENPSPVLRVERDGTVLFANRSSEAMLSLWRTEFGKDIPEPLRQSVEDALADGVLREYDANVGGREISFAVSPFPERNYANLYGRDITKRKQTEESLRRAKEEWERTFDSVPDLITILDNQHRVLRVNEAMARRLKHQHEDCVGRHCYEVLHGTSVPPEFCPHSRTLEDGCEHIEELHVDSLGGDFLVTTTPLLDKAGERIGSVHIARDITERKRMEVALRESERRLKRAQEISHVGSWELDLKTNELSWSDEVYRIFGFQPQEFDATYEAFLEAVHPEDRAAVDAAYSESLSEGKDSYEIKHRVVRNKSGDIRVVHEKCEHIRDTSGMIIRSVGMVQDITERMLAEEALRESESFYSQTLESIPGMVFTTRPDGYCDYQNRQWVEFTGVPVSEHLGDGWNRLLHPDDRPRAFAAWQAAVEGRASYDLEYRVRRHDGEYEWFKVIGRPICDSAGQIVKWFGVAANIDVIKRGEVVLLQAKEAAEAANRAKSQFLANMSHELRTPMTGVLGMLEITLSGTLDKDQRKYVEMADRSARSLLQILNDILDLTKIEAGMLTMEEKPIDLRECVIGVIDILIPEARSKGLSLMHALPVEPLDKVVGDPLRLRQILTNLVGNAVKFTEKGKVEVTVQRGEKMSDSRRQLTFRVTDTGIGIPADKRDILFNVFSQADESHSRRFGGTGLGLAICRELVERMGGTITCESTLGVGSSFSFTIPFLETDPEIDVTAKPVPVPAEEVAVSPGADGEKFRLLIAEDDAITRKILGLMLQRAGFDFEFAGDGRQAVEMWQQGEFDLIIMDGQMPFMDGFAAAATIRELERERGGHIPIVAMTAHALTEDEDRCLSAGMDAYISKPIDVRKSINLITQLIARRRDPRHQDD